MDLNYMFKENPVMATVALLIYAEKNNMSDEEVSRILDEHLKPTEKKNVLKIATSIILSNNEEVKEIIKKVMDDV